MDILPSICDCPPQGLVHLRQHCRVSHAMLSGTRPREGLLCSRGSDQIRLILRNPTARQGNSTDRDWRYVVSHPSYTMFEKTRKIVVLHFQGGAYVLGGCRPSAGGWGPDLLAKSLSAFVFCPQYCLASNPFDRFPAPLQDAVASDHHLLELGIPPSQIIISGNLAEGNVLLRYLSNHTNVLLELMAALLWSPWPALTLTLDSLKRHRNSRIDYTPPHLLKWALPSYILSSMDGKDQYLSPLSHEFSTKVPIFMQCGAVEVLYDEQISFFRRMKEVAGNKFENLELENAPHDTFLPDKPWGLQKKPRMQHLLHVISLRAKSYNMPCASSLPSHARATRFPIQACHPESKIFPEESYHAWSYSGEVGGNYTRGQMYVCVYSPKRQATPSPQSFACLLYIIVHEHWRKLFQTKTNEIFL